MVFFFCCVWGCVGEHRKGKQVFALGSSAQVKLISKFSIWKREGWQDSSYGKHFWPFSPSSVLHKECNSSCLKRNALFLTAPCWYSAQPGKPHLKKGKVFFGHRKTILLCLKHHLAHQTDRYLYRSPKGWKWPGRSLPLLPNQTTLITRIKLWETTI